MVENDRHPGAWFLSWRPSASLADALWNGLSLLEPTIRGRRLIVSASLVGVVPLLLGYLFAFWAAQILVGVLLAILLLPCVVGDRFAKAVAVVALAMGAHSVVAITLATIDPDGAARALRGSAAYWEETWAWVRDGVDREYTSGIWLPTHLALLVAVPFTAYTSFGVLPLARGIQEVDLMNYYVGRLIRVSERPELALLFGWHPWSFVRGLAYTLLVYEMMSLSVERFTGRPLALRRRRLIRFSFGLSLAILDCAIKAAFAPAIRDALFANLKPEAMV